jgi:hypothetical protein
MTFAASRHWGDGLRTPDLPMEIILEPYGRYRVEKPQELDRGLEEEEEEEGSHLHPGWELPLVVVADRSVDPAGLSLVDDLFQRLRPDGGHEPRQALTCPEVAVLTEGADRILSAISFAIGVALEGSHASLFNLPINTSTIKVLRGPVESSLCRAIKALRVVFTGGRRASPRRRLCDTRGQEASC